MCRWKIKATAEGLDLPFDKGSELDSLRSLLNMDLLKVFISVQVEDQWIIPLENELSLHCKNKTQKII